MSGFSLSVLTTCLPECAGLSTICGQVGYDIDQLDSQYASLKDWFLEVSNVRAEMCVCTFSLAIDRVKCNVCAQEYHRAHRQDGRPASEILEDLKQSMVTFSNSQLKKAGVHTEISAVQLLTPRCVAQCRSSTSSKRASPQINEQPSKDGTPTRLRNDTRSSSDARRSCQSHWLER